MVHLLCLSISSTITIRVKNRRRSWIDTLILYASIYLYKLFAYTTR